MEGSLTVQFFTYIQVPLTLRAPVIKTKIHSVSRKYFPTGGYNSKVCNVIYE
jgi:hypothetical protein